jgi:lipoate-protein ligase A
MPLPRQDTSLSLPAENPQAALAHDEALLDTPFGSAQGSERWWVASTPAVVIGLGLRHRLAEIVDLARCDAGGVAVLTRRAGGGAVWLDEHMLCGAICVPTAFLPTDLSESYRWLGDHLVERLTALGIPRVRRVDGSEARAKVSALRARADPLAGLL